MYYYTFVDYSPNFTVAACLQSAVANFAIFFCDFALDISQTAACWLRLLLSALLTAWIIWSLLCSVAVGYAEAIHAAIIPLCDLPVVGHIIPGCLSPLASMPLTVADFPSLVDSQSSSLELLLEESIGTASVSWDYKKAEIVSCDLIALIRISNLASHEYLANAIEEFVALA